MPERQPPKGEARRASRRHFYQTKTDSELSVLGIPLVRRRTESSGFESDYLMGNPPRGVVVHPENRAPPSPHPNIMWNWVVRIFKILRHVGPLLLWSYAKRILSDDELL